MGPPAGAVLKASQAMANHLISGPPYSEVAAMAMAQLAAGGVGSCRKAAIGTDADGTVCFYLVHGAGARATSAPGRRCGGMGGHAGSELRP